MQPNFAIGFMLVGTYSYLKYAGLNLNLFLATVLGCGSGIVIGLITELLYGW